MRLPEDDIQFRTGQRPPTPHAPFQRAPDAGADLRVTPPELFENRDSEIVPILKAAPGIRAIAW